MTLINALRTPAQLPAVHAASAAVRLFVAMATWSMVALTLITPVPKNHVSFLLVAEEPEEP